MLLFHIIVALTSVGFTSYLYFSPTQAKLNTSYGVVALTLGSGTYLVVSTRSHMLEACVMGLLYVAALSALIVAAHRKLAVQRVRDKSE